MFFFATTDILWRDSQWVRGNPWNGEQGIGGKFESRLTAIPRRGASWLHYWWGRLCKKFIPDEEESCLRFRDRFRSISFISLSLYFFFNETDERCPRGKFVYANSQREVRVLLPIHREITEEIMLCTEFEIRNRAS